MRLMDLWTGESGGAASNLGSGSSATSTSAAPGNSPLAIDSETPLTGRPPRLDWDFPGTMMQPPP
jgi:hypothetical protein